MSTPAPLDALGLLGRGLVGQLRPRLELLAVELAEEEIRFARTLGWHLFALFLACLAISLAVLLLVTAVWDGPHRGAVIATLLALAALGAAAGAWHGRRRARRKPVALSQTLEELRRDECALTSLRGDADTAGLP